MKVYDVNTNREYNDPDISLKQFIGTGMWVKVYDRDGFDYYIQPYAVTNGIFSYHRVDAPIVDDYDISIIASEYYSIEDFYDNDVYGEWHKHYDGFILYSPVIAIADEDMIEILNACDELYTQEYGE